MIVGFCSNVVEPPLERALRFRIGSEVVTAFRYLVLEITEDPGGISEPLVCSLGFARTRAEAESVANAIEPFGNAERCVIDLLEAER